MLYSASSHLESYHNCQCILFIFINRKAGKEAIKPQTKVVIEPQVFARDTVKLWGDCFLKHILLSAPVSRAGKKTCYYLKGSAKVFKTVLSSVGSQVFCAQKLPLFSKTFF